MIETFRDENITNVFVVVDIADEKNNLDFNKKIKNIIIQEIEDLNKRDLL